MANWIEKPNVEVVENEVMVQGGKLRVTIGKRKAKKGIGTVESFDYSLHELPPASIIYVLSLGMIRALGTNGKDAGGKLADLKSGIFRTKSSGRTAERGLPYYINAVLAETSPAYRKLKMADRKPYIKQVLDKADDHKLKAEALRRLAAVTATVDDLSSLIG